LSQRHIMRTIFVGKDGIRAGWSALLFVILYLILNRIETASLDHFNLSDNGPLIPSLQLVHELCDLLGVFLTTLVMARIERRNVFSYGFTGRHKIARLTGGLAC